VSLVRPQLPENREVNPEASFQLRGLKGLKPGDQVALSDLMYADRLGVIFWVVSGKQLGAAGTIPRVGIRTRADKTLIWVVDRVVASLSTTQQIQCSVNVGGIALPAYTTDAFVHVRSRTQQEQNAVPTRTGDSRIGDASALAGGTVICDWQTATGGFTTFDVGYRLFGAEDFIVEAAAAGVNQLNVTIFGRVARL
jgi:hypothetical protein